MPAQQKKSNSSKGNNKNKNDKDQNKNDKKEEKLPSSDSLAAMRGPSYPPETPPVKQKIPPKYNAEQRQKEKEEKEKKKKEEGEEGEGEEEEGDESGKKKEKMCDIKKREQKEMEDEIKQIMDRKYKMEMAAARRNSHPGSSQQQMTAMQMYECQMWHNMLANGCYLPVVDTKGKNELQPMGIGHNIHLMDSVTHDMKMNIPDPEPPIDTNPTGNMIDENMLVESQRKEMEKRRKAATKLAEERIKREIEESNKAGGTGTTLTDVLEQKYYDHHALESIVKAKADEVTKLFEKMFHMYKQTEILMSFNGGKDCTAVLHMYQQFLDRHTHLKGIKIPTLYVEDPDAFKEVNQFVDDCANIFNIELIKKQGPIKKALQEICDERPQLRAVLMGIRRTDPHCGEMRAMQITDPGYPRLMRINPILEWTCRDVWQHLYLYNVPYCILYQRGYTSIGNRRNTRRNPYLRVINPTTGEVVDYRPGHELLDNDKLERAGRL